LFESKLKELKIILAILQKARDEQLNEFKQTRSCSKDIGDVSDKLRLQSQQQSEIKRIDKRISDINIAIGAIADGSYGICVFCGHELSLARLDLIPEAVACTCCLAKQ
jgi:RNA polymerase-binding transcription factor DksA